MVGERKRELGPSTLPRAFSEARTGRQSLSQPPGLLSFRSSCWNGLATFCHWVSQPSRVHGAPLTPLIFAAFGVNGEAVSQEVGPCVARRKASEAFF